MRESRMEDRRWKIAGNGVVGLELPQVSSLKPSIFCGQKAALPSGEPAVFKSLVTTPAGSSGR
jgi:hypothetical protein